MTTNLHVALQGSADSYGTLSYDIRTLASGAIGALELLLDTRLDEQQRSLASEARASSTDLLELVNNLIDYGNLQAGRLALQQSEFDLLSLVEGAAESFAALARAGRASIMTYIAPEVSLRLRGDPDRLRQVLAFLIRSTLAGDDQNDIVVQVTRAGDAGESPSGHTAMLSFEVVQKRQASTGLDAFFAPANAAQAAPGNKTELEAAVCRGLVGLMRGSTRRVTTAEDSTALGFTASFTRVEPPATSPDATGNEREDEEDDNFLLGARVLVVDDSRSNRDVIYFYLKSWRLAISTGDCVASGPEALTALRQGVASGQPYDIALIDLSMPKMDGVQLARAIHDDITIANTSLVLLTAYDDAIHRTEAHITGFAAYLTKPVRQSQLLDAIASAVFDRRAAAHDSAKILGTPPASQPAAGGAPAASTRRHHVLVVEDNLANQKLALAQLDRLGYRAHAVSNGHEAVEEVKRTGDAYSLILMDCQMPSMDGFAATRGIREIERPAGRRVPIVAMTATVTRGVREMCADAGMDDYLSKPVSRGALKDMLQKWLAV